MHRNISKLPCTWFFGHIFTPLSKCTVRKNILSYASYNFKGKHVCAKLCNSLPPYGLKPARLPYPWDSPGKNKWSGLPCPPPGDILHPGIEPLSLMFPALAGGCFTTSATWLHKNHIIDDDCPELGAKGCKFLKSPLQF